jgi:fluoroacetyl-CoA thioesterase
MKTLPRTGSIGETRFVVEAHHAIDFADDEMPAVLCTPWLIWHLEHAARNAMLPLLEAGESTVGTEIEVQHSAATPLGQAVVCTARVVRAERSEVWFQLEARDETEQVARGFHKLRVISKSRFAARVEKKRLSR